MFAFHLCCVSITLSDTFYDWEAMMLMLFYSLNQTDAPQYHSSSCPCPMQSCPKNVATGTGPTNKAKGPVSANNTIAITENIPKISSATSNISCKIENILAPNVVIKPENKEKLESTSASKSHDLYPHSNTKVLEPSELMPSPARGLQIPPTIQHEAVQPSDSHLNNSSDNVSLSQRKQPRVGKSMERERQHQQHITMSGCQTTVDNPNHHVNSIAIEMTTFKQEYAVKKEGEVKKEKDCDDSLTDTGYHNINPIENVKLERPETICTTIEAAPREMDTNDVVTVNLINESGDDECIDYSMKRKLDDCGNDDVIELSDNSTAGPPAKLSLLKRRKLLEKPPTAVKKSPPNSYKSLIKQSNPAAYSASSAKSKLISSSINRGGNKLGVIRRNILKSKCALKKMRLAAKAKNRANKKKELELEKENSAVNDEARPDLDLTEGIAEISNETSNKCDDAVEETSTENNEEKSMDGSSEYSGKSNIDLTIDRVAKGYFSESDIFSCLSKHRKTKSQKKFAAKLLKSKAITKKKGRNPKNAEPEAPVIEKAKKKSKAAEKQETDEVLKTNKKKAKVEEVEKKKKTKKKVKEVEIVEKDPLALDDVPSSHSTPKRKPKAPKAVEKKTKKVTKTVEALEKVPEPPIVESDEDDKTVETIEPRDEETSTTVLSSTQTSKSHLDETDVANNNNECFEDNNNRLKQQESLTLYKTPGYGWTTFGKGIGKRGKKAKFGNRKKQKYTLLNDIVIPKSTSIPRWSNGWVWEAEPYQALVFLNVSFKLNLFLIRFNSMTLCNSRATTHQCREHATTPCVTRTAVTLFDLVIVYY